MHDVDDVIVRGVSDLDRSCDVKVNEKIFSEID